MKTYSVEAPYGYRLTGKTEGLTIDELREIVLNSAKKWPSDILKEILSSTYMELKKNFFNSNGFRVKIDN